MPPFTIEIRVLLFPSLLLFRADLFQNGSKCVADSAIHGHCCHYPVDSLEGDCDTEQALQYKMSEFPILSTLWCIEV